ncbi:hypothetical protein ZIOFF_041173 [Zingiber officinale]|uniref:Endoplasmic reticulum-Golgi intermediate compartment protein 3 n=1 Tax=Zingiber officinale TaxID=94328 RepID=A0A8J5KYK2_ZINOF|nr:hypothetical protein ZIOFF_041173 [Zingiber officinale]
MGLKLQSLSAFPRAEEHLLEKTRSGAVVSIIGLIAIATLFTHELKYYLTTYTVHEENPCRGEKFCVDRLWKVISTEEKEENGSIHDSGGGSEVTESSVNLKLRLIVGENKGWGSCWGNIDVGLSSLWCRMKAPMSVDVKRGETLPIHINMTFPSLPCDVLSVDAVDMSGKHEVDVHANMWKNLDCAINEIICLYGLELNLWNKTIMGSPLDEVSTNGRFQTMGDLSLGTVGHMPTKENLSVSSTVHLISYSPFWALLRVNPEGLIIGTQYLTDLVEKEHSDHKHGENKEHNEGSSERKDEQSLNSQDEAMIKRVMNAMERSEGCRVFGNLDVQRVAGNFHISVHGLKRNAAQQIFSRGNNVNVSHVIHDFSFGPKYPGIHNPLDGTTRILLDTSGSVKYFVKIVPTEYRSTNGLGQVGIPIIDMSVPIPKIYSSLFNIISCDAAVFFFYDLSPITVTIKEETRSFLHFIARLCAVLGGTFALTGMLDRWIYRIVAAFTKSRTGNKRRQGKTAD